jgi:short-subunit dehydrogenase
MKRTVLVTGASAGLGEAFAEVFAAEGFDVVITARREQRLHALAARLQPKYGVRVEVIVDDLEDPTAPARVCDRIASLGRSIDALVNNAGYGVTGVYTATSWERHAAFLQIMVGAPSELTHRLLPLMIERGYGRIINVASLAGLVPAPAGHTLYAPAKAYLIKFSEALAKEVRRHGVHVTAVCPGFTHTEFHDVLGTREIMNSLPDFMWSDADAVAREGFAAVMEGRPIHVTGSVNRTIATLVRFLPQWLVTGIARRTARWYRKT